MKFILSVLIVVLSNIVWSQKSFTFYLMGRPFPIERNNALRTVGLENKIHFEYAGNDLIESKGIEYYVNYNDSISKVIAATKLGENWLNDIYAKMGDEEKRQNAVREVVKKNKYFETNSLDLFSPIILLKKQKTKKNDPNKSGYKVYIVGQLVKDETRKFSTHLTFKYKKKNNKMKLQSKKVRPLPFTFPQNGLI